MPYISVYFRKMGLFTTNILLQGEFYCSLSSTLYLVKFFTVFTTKKLKKMFASRWAQPTCLDWSEIFTPGQIEAKWVVDTYFHSPRDDMLLSFAFSWSFSNICCKHAVMSC